VNVLVWWSQNDGWQEPVQTAYFQNSSDQNMRAAFDNTPHLLQDHNDLNAQYLQAASLEVSVVLGP